MTWKAKATQTKVIKGMARVTVEFSDGANSFTKHYDSANPTPDWLPRVVGRDLARIAAVHNFVVAIGAIEIGAGAVAPGGVL